MVVGAWTLSWATGQYSSDNVHDLFWDPPAGDRYPARDPVHPCWARLWYSLGEVPERPRGAGSASDRWSVCEGPQARVGGSTVDPTSYVSAVDP